MNWDKPKPVQPAANADADKVRPHRHDSSGFQRAPSDAWQPVGVGKPWFPLVRLAGLTLPSSWTCIAISVHWAWRLLGEYTRGSLEAAKDQPGAMALALVTDLLLIHVAFVLLRAVTATATPTSEPTSNAALTGKRALGLVLFLATLLRLVDLVHGALEKQPPTEAFWRQMIERPETYLLHGGALTLVVVALAATVLLRYALGTDLEQAQVLGETLPRGKQLGLVWGSAAVTLALTAWALSSAVGRAPDDPARVPEVDAVAGLVASLDPAPQP